MNAPAKTPVFMSSREFNQDTAKAKRAAAKGPVFITTRGQPSHVLMSKADFDRLKAVREAETKKPMSLAEALADNRTDADFDWEPPKMSGFSLKVPDFE